MSNSDAISDTMQDVASTENPSWFSQKLRRLVEGRVKTEIDAGAGLRKGTTSLILHRGNTPSPSDALRIANYFGVSVQWLFDEADERLDPVKIKDVPVLEIAPDFALIEELQQRYIKVALDVRYQLETIDGIAAYVSDYWQKMALDLAFSDGETDHNRQAVAMVENFMKLLSRAKRLWASAAIEGTKIGLADAKREGYALTDLHLDRILEYAEQADEQSPGLRFIVAYINARDLAQDLGNEEERHKQFFRVIAPFHVARVACHYSMQDDPRRDEIIKICKGKGYLTDEGKPAPIPDFIPWLPDEVEDLPTEES